MADKDEKKVAEKKNSDVVVASAAMFEADAGAGMQMTEDDLALPFLKIVSSELLNQDADIADKAKLGDMINSVTKQIYSGKTPIKVIPCHYKREFLMWAPRGSGNGAPLQIFAPEDQRPPTTRDPATNKDFVDNMQGEYIDETHQHFVLILEENGTWSNAMISMKSTQLKKSRQWNSMIATRTMVGANGPFTPPRFSHIYNLSTNKEENSKGVWHGWKIELEGPIEDPAQYHAAKSFHQSISAGDVTVKHEESGPAKPAPQGGNEASEENSDDIPW
jgi:hypothetical protein